jgi:DNA-binding protein H-NS
LYNANVDHNNPRDEMSKKFNLDGMTVDEMWRLYEEISQVLSVRLTSEKRELEKRLAQLRREKESRQPESPGDLSPARTAGSPRRKYPRVFPKYRNPKQPSETWSGRGRQPRWLAVALSSGHKIDEFLIDEAGPKKSRRRPKPA